MDPNPTVPIYELLKWPCLKQFASFDCPIMQCNFAVAADWIGGHITVTKHQAAAYESAMLTGSQLFKLRSLTDQDWVRLTAQQRADYTRVSS